MSVLWPNGGLSSPIFYRNASSGFRWTSAFGMRTHPVTGAPETFHYGLDMIGWSIIIAPVTGVVTFAGYNGGAGNEVRIREDGTGDVFRLLHNRELWVKTGQRVAQGAQVAVMGTTGSSTGVHCHEETRPGGGNAIDPLVYYARRNGGSPAGGGGDDMGAAEMAVLKNIEAILIGTGPSLVDPGFVGGAGSIYNRLLNLNAHVFAGGPSATDPNYLGAPGTVYALLKTPVHRTVMVDGKPVTQKIAQIQELADAKTYAMRADEKAGQLLARPAVELTPEDIADLARQLAEEGVGGASEAQVAAIVGAALGRLVLVSEAPPEPAPS